MRKPPKGAKGPRGARRAADSGDGPQRHRHKTRRHGRPGARAGGGELWLYGQHAVAAALANPARRCRRLLATTEAWEQLGGQIEALLRRRGGELAAERATREELAARLPPEAVHQGLALAVAALAQPTLAEILGRAAPPAGGRSLICALDQVTDPQNVGAILRSAAAFGAAAVLTTERNAPPESGALAKAASGALERLPYLREGNLARALDSMKTAGYWVLGLAAEGERPLATADAGAKVAVVLGAEGGGLRRLTRAHCDLLVHLPTLPAFGQLNVANAAAVAFYELLGRGRVEPPMLQRFHDPGRGRG